MPTVRPALCRYKEATVEADKERPAGEPDLRSGRRSTTFRSVHVRICHSRTMARVSIGTCSFHLPLRDSRPEMAKTNVIERCVVGRVVRVAEAGADAGSRPQGRGRHRRRLLPLHGAEGRRHRRGLRLQRQRPDWATTRPPTAGAPGRAGLSAIAAIAVGGSHSLAQASNGALRSWGYNAYGQLGLGNTTQYTTPQVVTAAAGLKGLTSGGVHVTGLKADNTATAWGYNGFGGLGDSTTTNRTSPVAVTGFNRGSAAQASYGY